MGLQLPPAPLFLFARAQLPRGGGLPFLPPTLFLSSLPTCHPSCTGPVSSPVLYLQSSSSGPGRSLTGSARPFLTRPLPPSQTPVLTPPLLLSSADWIPRLIQLLPCLHWFPGPTEHYISDCQLLQVSIPTRSLHLDAQKAPLTCSGPNRAPDLTPRRLSSISVKSDSILPGAQARSLAAIFSVPHTPHLSASKSCQLYLQEKPRVQLLTTSTTTSLAQITILPCGTAPASAQCRPGSTRGPW